VRAELEGTVETGGPEGMAGIAVEYDDRRQIGESKLSGYLWDIVALCIAGLALGYLFLMSRAVCLDEQLCEMEREITQLEGQLVLAKQELYGALTPQALGIDPDAVQASRSPEDSEPVVTPPLPPVEPSVMLSVAGGDAPELGGPVLARSDGHEIRTDPERMARTGQ